MPDKRKTQEEEALAVLECVLIGRGLTAEDAARVARERLSRIQAMIDAARNG